MIQSYIVWVVGRSRGFVVRAVSVSEAVAQVSLLLPKKDATFLPGGEMRLWAEPWEPAICEGHRLTDVDADNPRVTFWGNSDNVWIPRALVERFPEVVFPQVEEGFAACRPDEITYRRAPTFDEVELARQLFVCAWSQECFDGVFDETVVDQALEAARVFIDRARARTAPKPEKP